MALRDAAKLSKKKHDYRGPSQSMFSSIGLRCCTAVSISAVKMQYFFVVPSWEMYRPVEQRPERQAVVHLQAWTYAIEQSCLNKAAVVAADEREGGVRATLNLGHTFGHAIETGQGYGMQICLESDCTLNTAACMLESAQSLCTMYLEADTKHKYL